MPYVIVSTVALFANLYRNAPLIVGDKDSDPDLMRYLGARLSTSYPVCGSQPMYVMHAAPRSVFDNLEKKGYCLMAAQTIQEHAVWVLARPRVPEDDKTEIQRGGPNDKAIQASADEIDEQKGGRISKETETGAKAANESIYLSDKNDTGVISDSETNAITHPLFRVDCFNQSDVDLSASKGDHIQLQSIHKRDNSVTKNKNDKAKLQCSSPSMGMALGHHKSDLNLTGQGINIIDTGKQILADQILLDDCTQTGYGDILMPPYIPNLPKVVSECPTTPLWKKNSSTSLTNLISHNEPSIPKPSGETVTRLIEENPIVANISEDNHLRCLTQCEGCCCEEWGHI